MKRKKLDVKEGCMWFVKGLEGANKANEVLCLLGENLASGTSLRQAMKKFLFLFL